MLANDEIALLDRLREICFETIEPAAEAVDMAGVVPRSHLDTLAAAALVGVTTPKEFGGSGCGAAFLHRYVEILAGACGTTWFVLTQHLGSCGQIAATGNTGLRDRILREMAAGRHWVGVGFGHLRRPKPMVEATPVDGGWTLSGTAPWVTGWPILAGMIVGAHLPDRRHLYVYVPAVEGPTLGSSPPLPLCAMQATETTEVHFDRHFVPADDFVRLSSPEELARGDLHNLPRTTAPMLGIADGAIRTIAVAADRRQMAGMVRAVNALTAEVDACRRECLRLIAMPVDAPEYVDAALAARTWSIELAVRAAHAAVAASSGAANNRTHPAQRRMREAMFTTVFQQTGEILEATLDRLARPSN